MEPLALREIAQARMDFMLMKSCFMKIYKTVWIRNLLTDTPSSNMHPKGIVPKSIEINYDLWFVSCRNQDIKTKADFPRQLFHPNSLRSPLALGPYSCS